MNVRPYIPEDYTAIEALYRDTNTFGGEFDEARDTKERLDKLTARKPESILVAEESGEVVGTVTLFEDGRSAWLYRFAVTPEFEEEATVALQASAKEVLRKWGHTQVLVYAPTGNEKFEKRYTNVGFTKGGDYTAYWQDL